MMGSASPKPGDPAVALTMALDGFVRPAKDEGQAPDEDAIAGLLKDALEGPHKDQIIAFLAKVLARVAQGICPDFHLWP